jgi:uncharacterized membrane protein
MNFKVGDILEAIECDWSHAVLLIVNATEEKYQVAVLYNKLNGNVGSAWWITKRFAVKDYYRV